MSESLRSVGFQATPVGDLPADWRCARLEEIVPESRKVTYGIVQPGAHTERGVLLIRGQDYIKGWAKPDDFFRVARPLHEVFKRSSTVAGDVLICIVGATTGATNIVPTWITEANITQTTARVACDSRKADARFVLYALASELGQMQVRKYVKGSAQPGMNLADVARFIVPAPQPSEQRKIARILTTVDHLIEKTESLIAKYQAIKQGMMHDLFTRGVDAHGHLRPPQAEAPDLYKQSELGWIPKQWDSALLSDEFEILHGFAFQGEYFAETTPGEVLLVPGNFHRDGGLYFTDDNTKYYRGPIPPQTVLANGDLVVVMTDLSPRTLILGRVAQIGLTFQVLHNQRIGLIRPILADDWNRRCLLFAMNDERLRKEIILTATGTTVRHTSPARILANRIPKPPKAEQDCIAARLDQIERKMQSESSQAEKLRKIKTGLMQDLLTGKVRVKVDEAEEVAP